MTRMRPSYCSGEDVFRETAFALFNPEHVVTQGMRTWPCSLDPCRASATPCPHWCTHLRGEGEGIMRTVLTLRAPAKFWAPGVLWAALWEAVLRGMALAGCPSPVPLSLTFPLSAKSEKLPKPSHPGNTPEGPPVEGSLRWDRWTVQNKAGAPFCIHLGHGHPAPRPPRETARSKVCV